MNYLINNIVNAWKMQPLAIRVVAILAAGLLVFGLVIVLLAWMY